VDNRLRTSTTIIGLLAALLGACSDDYDPYNEVDGFRLLAIAADRPALLPGASTELSALLSVDPDTATYHWSWCPLTAGPERGYECAITREQLQAAADDALGSGVIEVPALDLGSEPTATFAHDLPAEFFPAVCEFLRSGDIPDEAEIPACARSFPLTIRLEVEAGGEVRVGLKTIEILADDDGQTPNQNPAIGAAVALHPTWPDVEIALADDGSTALEREVEYILRLDISASASETYSAVPLTGGPPESQREDLLVTWFVEAGATDVMRTAFLDGEISLDQASENLWTTPSSAELGASTTRLYFVIRDNRGGTSWMTRTLGLED
jgi:hypothetical protein